MPFTCELLIEPVWNRNAFFWEGEWLEAGILLIEPVWNRNSRKTFLVDGGFVLLIEPVWNRNRANGGSQGEGTAF